MKRILFMATMLLAVASVLSLSSCKKDDNSNPIPGVGVMGDWVSPTGVNYVNLVFTSQYTCVFNTALEGMESGNYSVNISKGEISLLPTNTDGAKERVIKYTRTDNTLTIKAGAVLINGGTALDKDLTLTVQ